MKEYMEKVKTSSPVVHNITNYVTANDCANILIACGASPIMADDISEVEEITHISKALNINIGTLNKSTVESMVLAGKVANNIGNPIVFDPVGVGASKFRTEVSKYLMNEIKFSVIKGNISEIKTIIGLSSTINGVDASDKDKITIESLESTIFLVKEFANRTGIVVVITGEIDIVCDFEKVCIIKNGHFMMEDVTGTGCQLSAVIAAYLAANPSNIFEATVAATAVMGVAGEIAYSRLNKMDGNMVYRDYIIDAIYNMTSDEFEEKVRYEVRK